ncbi:ABC transporter permease [Paenibacillus albiflavus]|uniref:ABC transporter permease n=1 Tax=Paenibacillus albiflavus TaxID=2545760 RepID=A0A4R4EI10_9BACL|nr:ABC transporter permease [Paenibacillus albiflavus]TCZ77815.1 ABC transporter permease [Paenibacillus albiflavus]
MWQYIVRRLLQLIPTLIGISIIVFTLSVLVPGDYIDSKTNPNLTAERAAQLRELYGLDKPPIERYVTWTKNMLTGNMGDSMQHRMPVTKVLNTYVWNSFYLSIIALFIYWIIAIIVGVFSAMRQYSVFDRVVTILVFAGMSLPSFFIALLLIKLFAVDVPLLPIGGMTTAGMNASGGEYYMDVIKHMILPVAVIVMLSAGSLTRYIRTSMLEVIRQDYIRTARAKGMKERVVIFKHALRNAMLPAITLLGFELPSLFGGFIIMEKIFIWPGAGKVYYDSIQVRDYPLLLGFTMVLALLTLLGNLIADVLYGVADPRIRLK